MIHKSPCTYCQSRRPTCHTDCKAFQEWKEEDHRQKEQRAKHRQKENMLISYELDRTKRMASRRKVKVDKYR